MIMEMGAIGAHSGTGVWRTVYSPEWVAANDLYAKWGFYEGYREDSSYEAFSPYNAKS
jgi:allantoate deiminase